MVAIPAAAAATASLGQRHRSQQQQQQQQQQHGRGGPDGKSPRPLRPVPAPAVPATGERAATMGQQQVHVTAQDVQRVASHSSNHSTSAGETGLGRPSYSQLASRTAVWACVLTDTGCIVTGHDDGMLRVSRLLV